MSLSIYRLMYVNIIEILKQYAKTELKFTRNNKIKSRKTIRYIQSVSGLPFRDNMAVNGFGYTCGRKTGLCNDVFFGQTHIKQLGDIKVS